MRSSTTATTIRYGSADASSRAVRERQNSFVPVLQVACKVVLMFSNYSILANYSWLLVEGHFLFTLVSRSFFSLKKHLAWYIALSWGRENQAHLYLSSNPAFNPDQSRHTGVPLMIIVSWGCAKYFYEDVG